MNDPPLSHNETDEFLQIQGAHILIEPLSLHSPTNQTVNTNQPIEILASTKVFLAGSNAVRKQFFCDFLMGFLNFSESKVCFSVGQKKITHAIERKNLCAIFGRSPFLLGETLQESLLYGTQNISKQTLINLSKKFFGPELRAKADPENPLITAAPDLRPILTQTLTPKEHLEVLQLHLILLKKPILVLDLSSELSIAAIEQGFRFDQAFLDSTHTKIFILPGQTSKNKTLIESLNLKADQTLLFN